jgi:energy-converting hydrogenase Eha subunit A
MTALPASAPPPHGRRRTPLRTSARTLLGQPSPLMSIGLAIVRTLLVLIGIVVGYVLAEIIGIFSGIISFGLC